MCSTTVFDRIASYHALRLNQLNALLNEIKKSNLYDSIHCKIAIKTSRKIIRYGGKKKIHTIIAPRGLFKEEGIVAWF